MEFWVLLVIVLVILALQILYMIQQQKIKDEVQQVRRDTKLSLVAVTTRQNKLKMPTVSHPVPPRERAKRDGSNTNHEATEGHPARISSVKSSRITGDERNPNSG